MVKSSFKSRRNSSLNSTCSRHSHFFIKLNPRRKYIWNPFRTKFSLNDIYDYILSISCWTFDSWSSQVQAVQRRFFFNRSVIFFLLKFIFDCRLMINPVICSAVSLTQQLHNNFVSYSSDYFELQCFQLKCFMKY